MRICVYCASSAKAPKIYGEAAFALGELLAKANVTVVYGGGGIGSMGRLADGVLSQGGELIGIMPQFMKEMEWRHPCVTDFLWTSNMAERKAALITNTDAIIALPGGSGTFEELLEVITLKRLGMYLKPIIVINQARFYDPLIDFFERCVRDRFMDERHLQMFVVVTEVEHVLPAISSSPEWTEEARTFATNQ